MEIDVLKERYLGFLNALQHFNLEFDVKNLILGETKDSLQNQINCIQQLKVLLTSPQRPTAIVCTNDISAYDVINCAVSIGLKIPEELSVIGNDNNAGSELVYPPLTTVGQPFYEIGQTAANEMLSIIKDHKTPRKRIYLSPSYVERQTVSYAPAD